MEVRRPTAYEAVVFLCAELALRRQVDVCAPPQVFRAALALVIGDLRVLEPGLSLDQLFDLAPVAMSDMILIEHVPHYVFRLKGAADDRVRLSATLTPQARESLLARVEAFGQALMPLPASAAPAAAAK